MTNLKTRIELDASGINRSAQEAAQALQGVNRAAGQTQQALGGLARAGDGLDDIRAMFAACQGEADRLRQAIDGAGRSIDTAGAKAAAASPRLNGMLAIGAIGAGFAVAGVSSALRATGHEKAADYTKGIGAGALTGAMTGFAVGSAVPGVGNVAGAVGGAVVGASAGAISTHSARSAAAKREAMELEEALHKVSLGSAAALRGIQSLENVGQAQRTLASLREEMTRLEQAMELGVESGPVAERQREKLGVQIGAAEERVAALRARERAGNIAGAREALGEYRQDRTAVASRQAFSDSIEAAANAAARMDLVNTRLDEFARRGDELRAALADVNVQADETRFAGLLDALREVDAESDRLQSMRFRDKEERAPRLARERDVPISTDALTRIGGGGGALAPMSAVERNTSLMARLLQSADRHLADLASRTPSSGVSAWA